jgi:hypothetical protein
MIDGLWPAERAARLVLTNVVSLLVLVAAAYEAHGAETTRVALAWFNAGLVALMVAAVTDGLWVLSGRRAVVLARVAVLPGPVTAPTRSREPATPSALVAGPRMTRYHRPSCPLVSGKTVRIQSKDAHERAGRRPCDTCEP